MKKKLILGISLFLMLLTLFALSISAAEPVETWDISATANDSVIANLYNDPENEGYYTLTITGNGNMKSLDGEQPWVSYRDKVTSVTVEGGVKNIGNGSFYMFIEMENATIESGVEEIGEEAFVWCSSLDEIIIPESITTIGGTAFDFSGISRIFIPKSVAYMGSYVFDVVSTDIYAEAQSKPSGWDENWNYSNQTVYWGHTHIYENRKCVCGIEEPYVEKWDISATENDSVFAYLCNDPENEGYYTLTITGNGNMSDWNSYADVPYSSYRNKIKFITIENGVTSIGNYAFYDCDILTSVEIPNSVTTIGNRAFYDCYSLTSIVIPDSVTTIGDYAFCYCYYLTSIIIPDSVTTIGEEAFFYCTSLTSVVIGNSVTTIGDYAFYFCDSLTSIIIPDSVTTIGEEAFYYCTSLTSIVIPDSVTTIGDYAFYCCESLTSVVIPDSVITIGNYAFRNCESLTSIVIPNSVTTIGYDAFRNCASLTIYAEATSQPSGWDDNWNSSNCPVVWGYGHKHIFDNKTDLCVCGAKNVYVGKWNISATENDSVYAYLYNDPENEGYYTLTISGSGNMFEWGEHGEVPWKYLGVNKIKSITVENGVTNVGNAAFMLYGALTSVTIPSSVTYIGEHAFALCVELNSIEVDENNRNYCDIDGNLYTKDLKTLVQYAIGKKDTSFTIPDSVTIIGNGAVARCLALTNVKIGNGVTEISDNAFNDCEALTSIVIPNSVVNVGEYAFSHCARLESIVIGDGVKSIGSYAFYGCELVTTITIPKNVTYIGEHVFEWWLSLENIEVDENNENYCDIDGNLYTKDLKTLVQYAIGKEDTSYTIPDSVTTISSVAFAYCSALTDVKIGKNVTVIGENAFSDCYHLTNVVIGRSVTSIGRDAFAYCTALKSVLIPLNAINLGEAVFYYCNRLTIYAEATSKPSGWSSDWNSSNRPVVWGHTHTYDFETDLCVCGAKNTYVEKWDISATSSDNVTATLYSDYSLVISGQGNMKNWEFSSKAPWYSSYSSKIKSVTIENGVTNIGNYAFYSCYRLTSIVIPDSVTTIGDRAFYNCSALTSVVIGDSVTAIGDAVFYCCDSLTSVIIGDSVETIGAYAFDGTSLKSIFIPERVATIGVYAFHGITSLISVEVSENNKYYCDIDGSLYTKDLKKMIRYAIGKNEKSLIIPYGVEIISYFAFEGSTSLTSIVIPDSVTTISDAAFSECHALTSLFIPNSVTTIVPHSISACESLTIYCEAESKPSGWDYYWNSSNYPVVWGHTHTYENGECVCGMAQPYVEKWDISATENDSVVATLYDDYSLVISGTGKMKDWIVHTYVPWYSSYRNNIKSITIEEGVTNVGNYAFYNCTSLISVVIGESVTSIGNSAFSDCTSLTSVVIGESVTSIGKSAFYNCTSLTSVNYLGDVAGWCNISFGSFDSNLLYYARKLYINNELVTDVVIPNTVASIKDYAFGYCDSLTSVVIPDSVTTIGSRAFSSCTSLTSVVMGDSVTTIGSSAFSFCDSLTSIVIPDSATSIDSSAFASCPSLAIYAEALSQPSGWASNWNGSYRPVVWGIKDRGILENGLVWVKLSDDTVTIAGYLNIDSEVIIPSAINGYSVTTIGASALYWCRSLTSIVIPYSVTSIGDNAFSSCDSLTSIFISNSVTSMGGRVFRNCNSLTIYCEAARRPNGWNYSWNDTNCPVVWGYFDKEATLGEIFTFLGYSFNEEGSMAVGYEINYEALRLYEEKTGETLEIGVVFAGYSLLNGNQPLDNEGNAIELTDGAVVKFDLTEYDYTYYDFIVTDIIDSIKDIPLVISAYINNGAENKYIQENGMSDTVIGISYNEANETVYETPFD